MIKDLSNFASHPSSTTTLIMSKLNAGAFEFVPGKRFTIPQEQSAPPPIDRPEQTEAPPPPPTISLNIGGAKPTPVPPVSTPELSKNEVKKTTVLASTPTPATTSKPSTPTPVPSKTFSTQKSKTDTAAIAKEVETVADQAVLDDLYGQGNVRFSQLYGSPSHLPS